MGIESHLTENETALDGCKSKDWKWVVTSDRILKYKKGTGTKEELQDVSIEKVHSIGLVRSERDDTTGVSGVVLITVGILACLIGSVPALAAGGILIVIGLILIISWLNSDETYFQFRGSGIMKRNPGQWKEDTVMDEDYEEVRDFVKTVRKQVNRN